MRIQTAKTDHKCDLCDKKIPKGDKYWKQFDLFIYRKEHTNCELYTKNKE